MTITVRELAHSRAGDKGHSVTISVIAYRSQSFDSLVRELTESRVMDDYSTVAKGPVKRYILPNVRAMNFVIENVRGGGVTASGALDIHGKSLSSIMLAIPILGNKVSLSMLEE